MNHNSKTRTKKVDKTTVLSCSSLASSSTHTHTTYLIGTTSILASYTHIYSSSHITCKPPTLFSFSNVCFHLSVFHFLFFLLVSWQSHHVSFHILNKYITYPNIYNTCMHYILVWFLDSNFNDRQHGWLPDTTCHKHIHCVISCLR